MRAAPPMAGMGDEGDDPDYPAPAGGNWRSPMTMGATITVSTPAAAAAAICRRMASRSPDRLGT